MLIDLNTNIFIMSHQTMLHFRSNLLQTMSTLLFSPLLLTGLSEQKQLIEMELFPDFRSDIVSYLLNVLTRMFAMCQHLRGKYANLDVYI